MLGCGPVERSEVTGVFLFSLSYPLESKDRVKACVVHPSGKGKGDHLICSGPGLGHIALALPADWPRSQGQGFHIRFWGQPAAPVATCLTLSSVQVGNYGVIMEGQGLSSGFRAHPYKANSRR